MQTYAAPVAPPVQQAHLFDMPSGAKLAITIAQFRDAWALTRAVLGTLKGMNLNAESINAEIVNKFKAGKLSPEILTLVLDRVVDFATSPEVEVAIWKCADRALYIPAGSPQEFPGDKVHPNLFDDPNYGTSAREDYAHILLALLEVNCKPFLVKALSGLIKPRTAASPDGQTSKSV